MKIKLTEDQYKRIFLNEQTPSDPSAFDRDWETLKYHYYH